MPTTYEVFGTCHASQVESAKAQVHRVLGFAVESEVTLCMDGHGPRTISWRGESDAVKPLDVFDVIFGQVEWLSLRIDGARGYVAWPAELPHAG